MRPEAHRAHGVEASIFPYKAVGLIACNMNAMGIEGEAAPSLAILLSKAFVISSSGYYEGEYASDVIGWLAGPGLAQGVGGRSISPG